MIFPRIALLTAAVTLIATHAMADVPGPRERCQAEGLGCESCWEHYGQGPEDVARYKACRDPLVAKGFVEGCRERQGAGDTVYFCPPGKKPETKIVGGGCAGCAIG